MRRLFLVILVALLAGVGVVALIETDPGYVLVAYRNYTVETSLWVGLLLLALFSFAVYVVVRLWRRMFAGRNSLAGWIDGRRARASSRLTSRGLVSFTEGNWQRARQQMLRGVKASEAPLLNYLVAARASYQLGEQDKMLEYLAAAGEAESEAGIAVELTHAELRLQAGQYEQALAALVRARRQPHKHPKVLALLQRAYRALEDWPALAGLLPDLRKHAVLPEKALAELERTVHLGLLSASIAADKQRTGEPLRLAWEKVPAALKHDAALLHEYVALLIHENFPAAAEKVIRRALKQQWDSALVRQYGYVLAEDGARQLAQAESWLPQHGDDAQLYLCLGRLSARNRLWGKARDYFESSYRIERTPEVCAELGRLLLALGEPKVAGAYFREGLQSRESALPALPMPEHTTPVAKRLAQS